MLGLLGLSGVSSAQSLEARPYPPEHEHCKIVINIKIVIVNGHVIIRGSGFHPNEHVNLKVSFGQIKHFLNGLPNGLRSNSRLTQLQAERSSLVPADESGSFAADVTLDQLGTATLTATGQDSGQATSDDVEVLPPGSIIPAAAAVTTDADPPPTWPPGSPTPPVNWVSTAPVLPDRLRSAPQCSSPAWQCCSSEPAA